MNFKKILAGAAASVVALSTMAAAVSADSFTVDTDKLLWGDPEGKGNLRIEIYNAYGSTTTSEAYDAEVSPINPEDFANVSGISVTFTLSGAPEGEYEAVLGFADGQWYVQDWETSITVTGDGTYTLTAEFTTTDDETGGTVPALATGVTVFVIDIKGMGADAGIETSDEIPYQMDVITVSDFSIDVTYGEPAADDGNDDGNNDDGNTDDGNTDDGNKDDGNTDDATTTTTTTSNNSVDTTIEGDNGTLFLIIGIVAAVVVVVIIVIVVVSKKKK